MTDPGKLTTTLGITLGVILFVLGVSAYVLTQFASVTALIPSAIGVVSVILGVIGRDRSRERGAVYGIGLVGLLGALGSARALPDLLALFTGGSVDSVVATISQTIMLVIGLVFLVAALNYTFNK